MSEPLYDVPVSDSNATALSTSTVATSTAAEVAPSVEAKDGVHDFEAALHFVRDGVKKLGDAAEDELIALAKKYL
ncbi:hypothetical protein [Pantoea ananatis]|uniref:hypothetical protein n=1 Tax=Pantoea ananas TaxID=553 RepID=UPI000FEC9305|nr:hypothetical protein [Pantoea ananatis]QAB30909.1 hypothetical protein EPK90_14475 [Pantoea ananatis]